jgi:hypothetical protein
VAQPQPVTPNQPATRRCAHPLSGLSWPLRRPLPKSRLQMLPLLVPTQPMMRRSPRQQGDSTMATRQTRRNQEVGSTGLCEYQGQHLLLHGLRMLPTL